MDQRHRARIGFAILALVVPTQFVVKAVADEPYPGLFMPEFGNVPGRDGQIRRYPIDVTVTFADGSEERFAPDRLMARNDATPNSAFTSMFDSRLDPNDPRTVAWFRSRIAEIYPGRDPRVVVIRVYRLTYSVADRSLTSRHQVVSHRIEVG